MPYTRQYSTAVCCVRLRSGGFGEVSNLEFILWVILEGGSSGDSRAHYACFLTVSHTEGDSRARTMLVL